jgi:hypothetical protein
MITLEGITLPDDIVWVDEYSGFGVGQIITPTLTTALVVEEVAQTAGRRITLESDGAWLTKTVVQQLESLAATPLSNTTLTLVWGDARTFDVVFDRSSGPAFEAQEVVRIASGDQTAGHYYQIAIRLITA